MGDFTKIFYTIEEAAELFRVHKNTIYALVRSKKLEHYRVGNQIRITAKELEKKLKVPAVQDDQEEQEAQEARENQENS